MAESQSAKAQRLRAESTRKPKPKAGEGGDGRALEPNDNQAAADPHEVEEAQLISIMDQLKRSRAEEAAEKAKVDAAKLLHKEAQNKTTKIFQNAKLLGFQRNHLEEHFTAIMEKGVRKNQQADEERRARWRRMWNLPVADSRQQELDAKLPETEKTASDYEADGYKAGLNSEERKAPAVAVKDGHDQAWLKGYDAATARKAWGLTTAKAIPMPANGAGTETVHVDQNEPAGEAV